MAVSLVHSGESVRLGSVVVVMVLLFDGDVDVLFLSWARRRRSARSLGMVLQVPEALGEVEEQLSQQLVPCSDSKY